MKIKAIYNWLKHPDDNLSRRVMHGGVWVFLIKIVNRGFGLIRTILLARLLSPNDFGLFGIAVLAISALKRFSETGFDAAIIQNKEDVESYLDPAWTIKVVRGLILAILLVFSAPIVGTFFGEPRAVPLVRVLGASVVVGAAKNIGILYFKKELAFNKQFIYRFSGTLADLAVAIPAALILKSVWALIFGLLANNFVRTVVSYLVHPYRPSIDFDWGKIQEMFDFGRWILGSSIIVFIATQGDDIFLGRVLGATALGFYRLAYRIGNAVATEITHVITTVTFPAYSKLQDNLTAFKTAFMRTLSLTTTLSIPLAVGIFLLIPEFTSIFLGRKWMPITGPVRVLTFAGAVRSITTVWKPLYKAIGQPNRDFKKNILRIVFTFTPIFFLANSFGISGVSIAVLCGIMAALAYDFYYVEKQTHLGLSSKEIVKSLFFPFIASIPFILLIALIKLISSITLVCLMWLVPISVALYTGSLYIIQINTSFSLINDIIQTVKGIREEN